MAGAKTARLNIRLNDAELAAIKRRAQSSGMGLSEYVRRCCLRDSNRPVIETDINTLRTIYANLRRCGGNLNQCAVALNRQAHISEEELSQAFYAVSEASSAVSNFITDVQESI